jgi:hypothetical protein
MIAICVTYAAWGCVCLFRYQVGVRVAGVRLGRDKSCTNTGGFKKRKTRHVIAGQQRQTKNWVLERQQKRQQIETWSLMASVLDPAGGVYLHFLHLE